MIDSLPPGALLIAGALLFPLLRGRLLKAWLVLLPVASFLHLLSLGEGIPWQMTLFDYELTPVRIDRLSLVFGYMFHLAALLSGVYALHVEDRWQHAAAMIYAGSAIGGVFAGDLVTLFVYWELTAISSVFLIWARHSDHLKGRALEKQAERSYRAGMRYLVIQVGSGVILLAGILLRVRGGGSLEFSQLGLVDLATGLIFVAFGIKAAFPLLHNWLLDAYPEATVTGTVFLSVFTTKMAIYALARGFAGTELLIYVGAAMTAFPIFFAVIVDDLRRVLAYGLVSQLGFMVCGIGLGSELALNGIASHAFAHIYMALLFMSVGAVLHRTGTANASELGGLYRSMPWTAGFCFVGAASISAFPLTSGFVTKSMVLTSAAEEHHVVVYLVLLFASAGVLFHSGLKVPYFAFFGRDSGKRVKEAPLHMLIAMGTTAALCLLIGIFPGALYGILPFDADYHPYTASHVVTQLQLLIFSALAFTVLNLTGLYPPEKRSTVLDTDWSYRRALPALVGAVERVGGRAWHGLLDAGGRALAALHGGIYRVTGPEGVFARSWPTGSIALSAALMLGAYLLFYFFY